MYHKAYGTIETLAPLHVGASAGEETGNLNLIFRDQFTQTGIIPGSSIRGRFRADMRSSRAVWIEQQLAAKGEPVPPVTDSTVSIVLADGKEQQISRLEWLEAKAKEHSLQAPQLEDENYWYGQSAGSSKSDTEPTEAVVKFEYASLMWLPVFCPGQPIVWVSCPRLLQRYRQIRNLQEKTPKPYTASKGLIGRPISAGKTVLFFNLGFLEIDNEVEADKLQAWIPPGASLNPDDLVIVADNDMAMIHDMALYRQSRVRLADEEKKVAGGAFFNVEALPEGSVLIFPAATKFQGWRPFGQDSNHKRVESKELYFGGLESVGFGRCNVTLKGDY